MYTDKYMKETEIAGLMDCVEGAGDRRYDPALLIEAAEEPTAFEVMLNAAMTSDERALLKLIDRLFNAAWQFDTGKDLRGELRRMWNAKGRSTRRFYTAFHALEMRRIG